MRLLSIALSLALCAAATAQTINSGSSGITTPTGTITTHQISDDGYALVPLKFGFPLYGKTFTNSVMYDNGVVGFFSPATPTSSQIGCDPTLGGCGPNNWYAQPYSTLQPSWNYSIAPLHSDLAPVAGVTTYTTQGDSTQMTYRWNNIGEFYNQSNLNTFSLQIKPSGFIGINYEKVNLGQSNALSGVAGDISKGEYLQHYYNPAGTIINNTTNAIPNWNIGSTGDACVSNPLSSSTCPGYTEAMCSANALYSTSCSGYAAAYLTQQCSANALYDPQCPGYAAAYLTYKCSLDPLYSTTCEGYEKAYFNKQCTDNPLYATTCPGYAEAYHKQQCSLNTLYANTCPGYAEAYFAQQCTIDGLYDKQCPNYAEAYAKKQLLSQVLSSSTPVTESTPTQTATQEPTQTTPTVSSTGSTTVDRAISTPTTSTSPAAPVAPVQLVQAPPPPAGPVATKEEKKDASTSNVSSSTTASSSQSETKADAKPTARQELAQRRAEAAKKDAVEKGANLANEMGKAADMESQKQVQNVVLQAMGYTPGFDAYGRVTVPDAVGYKPFTIYNNQRVIDNRQVGMRLYGPSDRLHNELVDSQYNKGK